MHWYWPDKLPCFITDDEVVSMHGSGHYVRSFVLVLGDSATAAATREHRGNRGDMKIFVIGKMAQSLCLNRFFGRIFVCHIPDTPE